MNAITPIRDRTAAYEGNGLDVSVIPSRDSVRDPKASWSSFLGAETPERPAEPAPKKPAKKRTTKARKPSAARLSPYKPPELPHAVALSRVFGRAPLCLNVAGAELAVRFAPGDAWAGLSGIQDITQLQWTLGAEAGTLDLPTATLRHLAASIEPTPSAPLDAATCCFLAELALAPQLEALEALAGSALRLEASSGQALGPLVPVALRGTFGDAPFGARLGLPVGMLHLLGDVVNRLPVELAGTCDVPVALAVRIGTTRLEWSLFASAVPGDALLLRETPNQDYAVVVAGERYAAPARLHGAQAVLDAPLRRADDIGLGKWTMSQIPLADSVEPPRAAMDDMEVTLVFELGRRPATLAELRGLAAGHVLEIGRNLSGPVSILANGQRIGEGELVKAGGALAVRILKAGAHG